jgi:predicted transcriptional regulator
MLKTIEEICADVVSQNILRLLTGGWMPIKVLVARLNVDRHTAYRRFEALEKNNLVKKSKRRHKASGYKIFGFELTEIGKILVQENKSVPSISFKYPIHSFEHNYIVNAKLFVYPESKTFMLSSDKHAEHLLGKGIFNMLSELTRDPDIHMVLGNCRLILDCKFESIAEMDVYEFYRECLSPSLESYIKDRTFLREKETS